MIRSLFLSTARGALIASAISSLYISVPETPSPGPTPTPTPTPLHVLSPPTGWDGTTTWVGRPTPPTPSSTPLGTLVPDEIYTGGFSSPPGDWVDREGIAITALGLPPQPADSATINYFKEAVFWLEGETWTVTDWSVNDTEVLLHTGQMGVQGSVGAAVEIGPGIGAVKGGDAELYCTLRGDHGLERVIGPVRLAINIDQTYDTPTLKLNTYRPVLYVASNEYAAANPGTVSDSNAGTSPAAPMATINKALRTHGTVSGRTLLIGVPGQVNHFVEDDASSQAFSSTRPQEVEVYTPGITPDQMVITRSARLIGGAGVLYFRTNRVILKGVSVDLSKCTTVQASNVGAWYATKGCILSDPNGANGPRDANGYDIGYSFADNTAVNSVFINSANSKAYICETYLENYSTSYAQLYRNVVGKYAADVWQFGAGYNDLVVDGFQMQMTRTFHQRLHSTEDLTLSVPATVNGAGRLILPYAETSASFTPETAGRPDVRIEIVTGFYTGTNILAYFQDSTGATNGVANSLSAAAGHGLDPANFTVGDKYRYYIEWHSDMAQHLAPSSAAPDSSKNTTIFRYYASSPTSQLFLTNGQIALYGTTTITSTGEDFTLDCPGKTISSITISGTTATVTTSTAHGLSTGRTVRHSGATDAAYNGDWVVVSVPTSTTYTYTIPSPPGANATVVGTYVILNVLGDSDVIKVTTGTNTGEYSLVKPGSWNFSTQTGKLLEPFADQSGSTVIRGKSVVGFAMALSTLHKWGTGTEFGQFQDGHRNWILAHNTFVSQNRPDISSVNMSCLGFRNLATQGHGNRNHVHLFNIYRSLNSDLAFPTKGVRIDYSHFEFGTNRSATAGTTGQLWDFSSFTGVPLDQVINTYVPSPSVQTCTQRPLVPYDAYGRAVDSTSPAGACNPFGVSPHGSAWNDADAWNDSDNWVD